MTSSLLATFGLYLGTFVVCLLAGLIPLINAEVYLVGVTLWAVDAPAELPVIVVLASLGQMVAKLILYYMASGATRLPRGRMKARLEAMRERIDRWRSRPYWVLAVSSTIGLPPLYLVSLAAGAMKMRIRWFLLVGMAGRLVHFGVVVALAWWA